MVNKVVKLAIIAGVIGYLVKRIWEHYHRSDPNKPRSSDGSSDPTAPVAEPEPQPEELPQWSLAKLKECTGLNGNPKCVSLKGIVYDVSSNDDGAYDPPSEYHSFLGHDCTYAYAHYSTDATDLDKDARDCMDSQFLQGFIEHYEHIKHYPKVATLIDPPCNGVSAPEEQSISTPERNEVRVGVFPGQPEWCMNCIGGGEEASGDCEGKPAQALNQIWSLPGHKNGKRDSSIQPR